SSDLGITREEAQTGGNTTIIFGICLLLIYLILSALYESFLLLFTIHNTEDAAYHLHIRKK
ncbi:hypothetical protein, partial [Barnesiella intestinihominis]|uniref:hypothetical protein n=1 Tax=Barnesiella intestinihominis TaxID=487174 RepID=UPI003AB10D78